MNKHFYSGSVISLLMFLFSMLTFKSSAQTNTFPATGPVGIGTLTPASGTLLHIDGGGLLMTGTIGSTPIAGGGTRLMWIPAKAAFRAGLVGGTEWDDANIGLYSFAGGAGNIASGPSSFAVGGGNTASGSGATAFGGSNIASGTSSTAFGDNNTASGISSVAFGSTSTASGDYSIAFGNGTKASGWGSTAFGDNTTASGSTSTAFGQANRAAADNSTAYGTFNSISNTADFSTAYGSSNTASAKYATVFGNLNTITKDYATCFGYQNNANGQYSTVYGTGNNASGEFATSFGLSNNATGYCSTVYGDGNTASGQFSTCFGDQNTATADYSTALGESNTATGEFSFVSGMSNKANSFNAFVTGQNNTAQSYNAFVTGQYNIDNGDPSNWVLTDPLFIVGNGLSDAAKNNAVTVLKNGNVGINKIAPQTSLDVNGTGSFTGFRLGTTSTNGYVLTSDNTGLGTWQPASGAQWSIQDSMLTSSSDVRIAGKLHVGNSSLVLDGAATGSTTGNEIYNDGKTLGKVDLVIQSCSTNLAGNTVLHSNAGNTGRVQIGPTPTIQPAQTASRLSVYNSSNNPLSFVAPVAYFQANDDAHGFFYNMSLLKPNYLLESNVSNGPITTNLFSISNLGKTVIGHANSAGVMLDVQGGGATIQGNVLIGKTTSTYKLDVAGPISSSGSVSGFSVGSSATDLTPNNTPWYGLGMSNTTLSGEGQTAVQIAGYGGLTFKTRGTQFTAGADMTIQNGKVLIGTTCLPPAGSPYKLAVNGTIVCKEINVELPNASGCFPDYVFEKDYKLTPLHELEKFIAANKHLPEIPSAKEVEENGMKMGEMNVLLLKKIEELTLHLIEQDKKIKELQIKINQ
jgi:hypothetical protein